MLSTVAKLVSKVSTTVGEKVVEKEGHFYLDNDTPLELAKMMVFDFLKYIGQVEDNVRAQQAAVQTTETPAEAVPAAAAPQEQPPEAVA